MSPHFIAKKPTRQLNEGVFEIWKERGETLAMLLLRFRKEEDVSPNVPITYAGRLDPMAEGIVLLLCGEARFKKEHYLGAKKIYEMEIVLGVTTDTLDILGVIVETNFSQIEKEKIEQVIESIKDITILPYPLYSSRPVEGKPLFLYAREGKEVEVPNKKVQISSVELLGIEEWPLASLIEDILKDVGVVVGDFRQKEIIDSWEKTFQKNMNEKVVLVTIRAEVSSGTYMRSLAKWVGEQLKVPALAYRITRFHIEI